MLHDPANRQVRQISHTLGLYVAPWGVKTNKNMKPTYEKVRISVKAGRWIAVSVRGGFVLAGDVFA